jgi:hypothetical protein
LLPYLDQAPAFNRFDFTSDFDTRSGYRTFTAAQQSIYNSLMVPGLNCPSSELKKYGSGRTCGDTQSQRPHYVGISGSGLNAITGVGNASPGTVGTYGIYVENGVLAPNGGVPIAEIVDGTSNTIVMGEQGRPAVDPITLAESDNRSCQHCGGAWEGCYYPGGWTFSSQFCQNLTNIYYGINNMDITLSYASTPYMSSNPLSSRHTGGAHALRGDGTVVFLSQNINFLTLLRLAHKSDNQTVGEY